MLMFHCSRYGGWISSGYDVYALKVGNTAFLSSFSGKGSPPANLAQGSAKETLVWAMVAAHGGACENP